jgi:hypothetical protein
VVPEVVEADGADDCLLLKFPVYEGPMPSVYFPFYEPPVTGGDFVAVDHIAELVRLGHDAKALVIAGDDITGAFQVPAVRARDVTFQADDVLVIGEIHLRLFVQMRGAPMRKVLHCQNPYYLFQGFSTAHEVNAYGFARAIVPSRFTASKLAELGVTVPADVIRPALPTYFHPRAKRMAIAFSPRKRRIEAIYISGAFRSAYPELAHVPWVAIGGDNGPLPRETCARVMGECAVYAAFPALEGLGLMGLEAMASGCIVVGYTGYGGAEYATSDNGLWVTEGDHRDFLRKLKKAIDTFKTAPDNRYVRAGVKTAKSWSAEAFRQAIARTYGSLLGNLDPSLG